VSGRGAAARAPRPDPGRAQDGRRRRQAWLFTLLAFTLSLFAVPSPRAQGVAAVGPETRRSETIAPGVERLEIRRGDFDVGIGPDRWTINVLVLDPSRTRLGLGRAGDKGVGTETTSSMARRLGAVAAVNAGFFRTSGPYKGEPAGIVIRAGKVLSEPYHRRPGLAVSNAGDRTRLAVVDAEVRLEAVESKSVRRRIDGVNRPRLDDELILFTPEFDRSTLTGEGGAEAVVVGGRVTAIDLRAGDAAIPRFGWVLSGHGAAAAWIRGKLGVGGRIEVRSDIRLTPRPSFAPEFVVDGGPRLVREGRPVAVGPETGAPGFVETRHPRTAVGVRADGRILLVTVDGRQPEHSVGMTIAELAAILRELGAVEAINMDGGGSTTMVAGGRVVNHPSDLTGERPVGDALLVLARSPD
jgi:exopolysaccharide biosynthesis protein